MDTPAVQLDAVAFAVQLCEWAAGWLPAAIAGSYAIRLVVDAFKSMKDIA